MVCACVDEFVVSELKCVKNLGLEAAVEKVPFPMLTGLIVAVPVQVL
jgi:hypothetical protein